MLKRIDYKDQHKPVLLTKGRSTSKKLEQEMNEPIKDYNRIKQLIENYENSIEK